MKSIISDKLMLIETIMHSSFKNKQITIINEDLSPNEKLVRLEKYGPKGMTEWLMGKLPFSPENFYTKSPNIIVQIFGKDDSNVTNTTGISPAISIALGKIAKFLANNNLQSTVQSLTGQPNLLGVYFMWRQYEDKKKCSDSMLDTAVRLNKYNPNNLPQRLINLKLL